VAHIRHLAGGAARTAGGENTVGPQVIRSRRAARRMALWSKSTEAPEAVRPCAAVPRNPTPIQSIGLRRKVHEQSFRSIDLRICHSARFAKWIMRVVAQTIGDYIGVGVSHC
jgi:hypothetical protein